MSLARRLSTGVGSRTGPELLVPTVLGGLLVGYFALPFVTFLGRTGSAPLVETLARPASRTAIRNSLLTAPVSTAIATVLGVPLAYVLARGSFRGKRSSRRSSCSRWSSRRSSAARCYSPRSAGSLRSGASPRASGSR